MQRAIFDYRTGQVEIHDLTPDEVASLAAITADAEARETARLAALPQFGSDSATVDQVADAVTQLRAYLALPAPNNAQTVAAFKLLIRVALFILRRLL